MLIVSTWIWGRKYGQEYIERLAAGVTRHMKAPHVFRVFEPLAEDAALTEIPGCFARLRMFDPAWQAAQGIAPGDRIVNLDLDAVVTGDLDDVFGIDAPFAILQGANAENPCPYNGSLMSLVAGAHPEVWSDFSLEAVSALPKHDFADDQQWLAHKLPGALGWTAGEGSGVYAFCKPGWPKGTAGLPRNARLVFFPGWRDPSGFTHLEWVKQHWIAR